MKRLLLAAFLLLTGTTALAADPDAILGCWKTEKDRSELEIYRCAEKLCGKVVWLKNPEYVNSKDGPVGTPKIDRKNPDPALRDRPIIGMTVIEGLTPKGENRWGNGVCYDPESGNTYKCNMRLASDDRLEVRGYIGISLFGRTYVLARKESPAPK